MTKPDDPPKSVTISTKLLRLAQACAAYNPERRDLEYIMLDFDANRLVATNGHMLLSVNDFYDASESSLSGRKLVRIFGTLPLGWDLTTLDLTTGVMQKGFAGGSKDLKIAEVLDDGKDIDFVSNATVDYVLNTQRDATLNHNENMGFNSQYINKITAALNIKELTFLKYKNCIGISFPKTCEVTNYALILMCIKAQ